MKKKVMWVFAAALVLFMPVVVSAAGAGEETTNAEELVTITVAQWDFIEYDDALSQKIEADLNLTIEPRSIDWGNAEEQALLWAAADDLPDLLATYTVEQDINRFYSWIDQGLIRSIPRSMIPKYPLVKKLIDDNVVVSAVEKLKGGVYFLPRPGSPTGVYKASQQVVYYRADWAQKLGLGRPETSDELFDLAVAFTEMDPDGNGKNDTGGFTATGAQMYSIFGTDMYSWVEEDGQYIPAFISSRAKEIVTYMQRLYRDGYLDPEYALNGWSQALQKFSQGSFGIVMRNGDTYWLNRTINRTFGAANPDLDAMQAVGIAGPFKTGGEYRWPLFIDTCGTEISSKVDDVKLDRILALYDYLLTPEMDFIQHFGFEGDYHYVDGQPMVNRDADGNEISLWQKYPSFQVFTLTDWDWDWDLKMPGGSDYPDEIKLLSLDLIERYGKAAVQENLAIRFIPSATKDILPIFGTWDEAFHQIVLGEADASIAFDAFVREWMNKGLDKAIAEVNAEAKRLNLD